MSRTNLVSRLRSMWGTLFQAKESPREFQERQDLYKSIMALTYRNQRHEQFSTLHPSIGTKSVETRRLSNTRYARGDRDQLETILEQVTTKLDSEVEIYRMSIKGLRYELQNLLIPQILSLFQSFHAVDTELSMDTEEKSREILRHEHEELCKLVVAHRHVIHTDTTSTQPHLDSFKVYHSKAQILFLERHIKAIETLFSYYNWKDLDSCKYTSQAPENHSSNTDVAIDSFGYNPTLDKEQVSAIRYHQRMNVTKAILLRQKLGFSVVALQSTIPNSGRGIFLNGFAPAGTLLAFFPGQVWPKEYLLNSNNNETTSALFKEDPNYMLSLRYDDILIDSRKAPFTVLSNPFSIAHIANHPPLFSQMMGSDLASKDNKIIIPPNCHTVMLNFTQGMNLKDQDLEKYLPNTYARPPQMLGSQMFDRDVVSLHGMGLLASRDVSDEELFYDYRLSPTKEEYPPWYSIVDETDLRNRWFHDKDK